MTALHARFAALLLAVLTAGGVVLPSAHAVAHGLEAAQERAEHATLAHGAGGDHVQTPCAPALADADCAVCTGLTVATGPAEGDAPAPEAVAEAVGATAEWRQEIAASGAGARAPPVS